MEAVCDELGLAAIEAAVLERQESDQADKLNREGELSTEGSLKTGKQGHVKQRPTLTFPEQLRTRKVNNVIRFLDRTSRRVALIASRVPTPTLWFNSIVMRMVAVTEGRYMTLAATFEAAKPAGRRKKVGDQYHFDPRDVLKYPAGLKKGVERALETLPTGVYKPFGIRPRDKWVELGVAGDTPLK